MLQFPPGIIITTILPTLHPHMVPIKITPKQKQILLLLYRFRFLNRYHIQKFLSHKYPKRINIWLKDLTNKKIVGRIYSNKIGENNKPAIYYLDSKSHNILKEEIDIDKRLLKRVYRERLRSKRLREHCLLVAEIHFLLEEQIKQENNTFYFFTKTDLIKHSYVPTQRPDYYIALEALGGTKRYFLEIIDPDTPRFALRKKVSSYFTYFDENTWQEATGYDFPSILIVAPSESTKYYLNSFIDQMLEQEMSEINFYLTTSETLTKSTPTSTSWKLVELKN